MQLEWKVSDYKIMVSQLECYETCFTHRLDYPGCVVMLRHVLGGGRIGKAFAIPTILQNRPSLLINNYYYYIIHDVIN